MAVMAMTALERVSVILMIIIPRGMTAVNQGEINFNTVEKE